MLTCQAHPGQVLRHCPRPRQPRVRVPATRAPEHEQEHWKGAGGGRGGSGRVCEGTWGAAGGTTHSTVPPRSLCPSSSPAAAVPLAVPHGGAGPSRTPRWVLSPCRSSVCRVALSRGWPPAWIPRLRGGPPSSGGIVHPQTKVSTVLTGTHRNRC